MAVTVEKKTVTDELLRKAQDARAAVPLLARTRTDKRDKVLRRMAQELRARKKAILEANREDVREAEKQGAPQPLIDRLALSEDRIEGMALSLEEVATLPDPLGEGESWVRPNGLQISRIRVPLGVIGIIYEARPNVTLEASSLAFKAGNVVLLRGSSSALRSNRQLVAMMGDVLEAEGMVRAAIQLIENTDRDVIDQMVRLNKLIDVVIPRGGHELIQRVVQSATVPVIETGEGNCHVYVDEQADLEKARRIIINAKTQRPGVCNAAESLLVHRSVAKEFLRKVGAELSAKGVELRACPASMAHLPQAKAATEEDWGREFLDLVLSVRVVDNLDEAIDHINRYGTHHSDAIVTENYSKARAFLQGVDSAAVYVNASTRFTDGSEFGFGGELGISTQRLHARGPMGLRELTTTKYIIMGDGHIRE